MEQRTLDNAEGQSLVGNPWKSSLRRVSGGDPKIEPRTGASKTSKMETETAQGLDITGKAWRQQEAYFWDVNCGRKTWALEVSLTLVGNLKNCAEDEDPVALLRSLRSINHVLKPWRVLSMSVHQKRHTGPAERKRSWWRRESLAGD